MWICPIWCARKLSALTVLRLVISGQLEEKEEGVKWTGKGLLKSENCVKIRPEVKGLATVCPMALFFNGFFKDCSKIVEREREMESFSS